MDNHIKTRIEWPTIGTVLCPVDPANIDTAAGFLVGAVC